MFKKDRASVDARRAGRLAFGGALIAGAVLLADLAMTTAQPHAAWLLAATWCAALAAGRIARGCAARWRAWSVDPVAALVVPSVGVALLAPLSIHAIAWLLLAGRDGFDAFDRWVQTAGCCMLPTHAVFAVLVGQRARGLIRGTPVKSVLRIFITTLLVSCVPFGTFILPPIVVALTGLPLVLALRAMATIAAHDAARDAVGLPVAIVRPHRASLAA